ncbi:hypothetical protein [Mycolicibacterium sp. HK-90]|uniref:hypothetical protein n=1 Tax=Mycolicibacterium sp. HK-90 TaxID=3056937 RepID=UPI002659EFE8|nr:hypothetical protein [Mycolicibacterium sp. HK-90]WKG05060.1 hypothetical protein QU592_08245 [Mycolicibacterium sp. HK-90]
MQLTLRPYVTAGVAIVGASVIAATPITPAPTATAAQIQNRAVQLTAATCSVPSRCPGAPSFINPIQRWGEVFERASFNLGQLAEDSVAAQGALLGQIIANQTSYVNIIGGGIEDAADGVLHWLTEEDSFAQTLPETLAAIREALSQGDVIAAGNAVTGGITGLQIALFGMSGMLSIPYEISRNITAALETFAFHNMFDAGLLAQVVQGIASGLVSTMVQAISETGQALVDASGEGDPLKAVSAIVNFPADMTYAFLNGVYFPPRPIPIPIPNPPMAPEGWTPGILTDAFLNPLRTLLVVIPQAIAEAITPPADAVVTNTDVASTATVDDVTTLQTVDVEAEMVEPPQTTRPADELTRGVAHSVDSIASTARSMLNAARTATLSLTPQGEAVETQTSAESDAAGSDAGSSATEGGSDTSANKTADSHSSEASSTGVGKESTDEAKKQTRETKREARRQARAERQQARQEAKAAKQEARSAKQASEAKNAGGKHRADKSSDK